MENRENRFIVGNIYDEELKDESSKEDSDVVLNGETDLASSLEEANNSIDNDNFIDDFKIDVNLNSDESVNDLNNLISVDEVNSDFVSDQSIKEDEVYENVVEEPIEDEPIVYDAVQNELEDDEAKTIEEKFDSGRNLQDMINQILRIGDLEPVKVEIAGYNDKQYEEKVRIREEEEQRKREQNTFQNEIAKIMEKDNTEVVFKSNLLDFLGETKDFSMLVRYGEDYCSKDYVTNPAIGRDSEIKQLILTLLTPEKSAILIGKPGIGKTSIVEGLAYRLERGLVPDALKNYSIINIKTPSLLGTLPNGETKLQTLVDELKTLDKVILFIDEIHMLIGATNDSSLDFANMFKEGLGRGQIKIVGATTTEEYERYILRDKAFVRRFQSIEVLEPNREHTIKILMGTIPKIERETGAKMKYSSFIQSEIMGFITDITSEYKRIYGIGSRYPDICLTLLKEAFSQCIFNNRNEVTIFDIRNAILNSKNIYPDVIRKEIINFDEKFKKIIEEEDLML